MVSPGFDLSIFLAWCAARGHVEEIGPGIAREIHFNNEILEEIGTTDRADHPAAFYNQQLGRLDYFICFGVKPEGGIPEEEWRQYYFLSGMLLLHCKHPLQILESF